MVDAVHGDLTIPTSEDLVAYLLGTQNGEEVAHW